jgi:hypothetical protein
MSRVSAEFLKVVIREFGEALAREDVELADAWLEVAFRLQRTDMEDANA